MSEYIQDDNICMAPRVSVDEAAQGLMATLQALRAEGDQCLRTPTAC